jgi:putative methyltransferase
VRKKYVYLCQVNYTYGNNTFLPYSVGSIASYCKTIATIEENYIFKPLLFLREKVDKVVENLENPSVFGFSCYLWNFEYNKALAKKIKEKYEDCLIVFGGPHISKEYDGIFEKEKYIDILVYGEGEIIFADILVENLNQTPDFKKVKGLLLKDKTNGFFKTGVAETVNVTTLPSPYTSGIFEDVMTTRYDFTASFETNRGCPYSCTFCEWGFPDKAEIRKFKEERVAGEIAWFGKHKIEMVFGCD